MPDPRSILTLAVLVATSCDPPRDYARQQFDAEAVALDCPAGTELAMRVGEGIEGESAWFCSARHGPYRNYAYGKVHEDGLYDFGRRVGVWRTFDDDGGVVKTEALGGGALDP